MNVFTMIVGFLLISLCLIQALLVNGQEEKLQQTDPAQGVKYLSTQEVAWRDFKRVCYFRMDPKLNMEVLQIDGNLCTHIILAFCRIDNLGNVVVGAETDERYLKQVAQLKVKFPRLKVLVSLYNEGEFNGFVAASKSSEIRKR